MRTLLRWLRRGLLGLGLLLLLAAGAVAGLLLWSLPPATGRIALPTLSRPVEVGFDAHGIPRIRAEAERDSHVALGFLHARDRLFQMEAMRRGATGRLAEIGGAAALRLDRMVRVLGLERRAAEDLAALDQATREALAAYAEGVNAWIALRGRFAAPEFVLLGAPEPWRAQDSLLWAKVMGLWLSANWRTELERARLAATLPPARLAELWPADGSAGRPDLAEAAARSAALDQGGHLGRLLAALPRFPGDAPLPDSASNAWAVVGARSASGAPLLATDPHLGFGAPILWYLARIELPGRVLVGATAPGVPGIVIGRNERIAWGFTTTHSDTQDVFVERLAGPDAYETPDGPRPFLVREEVIRVRGADPVVLRVRETRHGPVVSDLDGMGAPPEGHVLAVAMANLAPRDTAAAGLLALNRAGSVAEAREAARLITSPPQNLMVADAAGRIAMFLTGRTPVRRSGDGRLPVPGWDGAADWTGFVPFDAMPHAEDPPGGLLANANNRVVPPESSVFLGEDWYGDWRFRRIGELAAARPRHDAAGFLAMQADAVSLFARETLPVLHALPPQEGTAAAALALLGAWDGEVAPGLPQPLLFNAWWREFGRAALTEGGVPPGAWEPSPEFVRFVLRPEGAHWCGPAGCRALAAAAWARAITGLAARFGPDPSTWRWGQAHVARFEHPLLRFVPVIGPLVRLEAATPGDGETLNRGGLRGGDFAHVHGAGFRGVFDLAAPDGALAVIAGGQSGHPLSRHWGDLLPLWLRGEAVRPGAEAGPGLTLAP